MLSGRHIGYLLGIAFAFNWWYSKHKWTLSCFFTTGTKWRQQGDDGSSLIFLSENIIF